MAKVKICGITREEDITYLNEAEVDYAGFVFYEKSKRYIPVSEAKRISEKLNPTIRKVAVTVTPEPELIREIEEAGFDILQVHGEAGHALREAAIPVWLAANLKEPDEVHRWRPLLRNEKVSGILFDAGDYGSGKTFGWEGQTDTATGNTWREAVTDFRKEAKAAQVTFILAGGLHAGNVADGMKLFVPDVVDVSSGVEEMETGRGKSRKKIEVFVQTVRSQNIGME